MITSLAITNYHSPDAHLIGGRYFSLSLNSFKPILIFQKGSWMLSYASSRQQFVALYKPCKPKPKPSTYDTPHPHPPPTPHPRTTTPWQRSKFRYLDRSQSNKYAINMQIQTISVSK